MTKIKVGLLVDSLKLSDINSDLAYWIDKQKDLEISLIINNNLNVGFWKKTKSTLYKYSIKRILEKILFKIIFKFEQIIFNLYFTKYKYDRIDLNKKNFSSICCSPNISKNSIFFNYSDKYIDEIKSYKLDLIIRMGSGILKGEILNAAKYGVLSFHHGDNEIYRGGPAGFWEVYHKQAKSGFIIQQLNDVLDGGNILKKGYFTTKFFFYYNQVFLYKKSNYHFKKLLTEILAKNKLPYKTDLKNLGKIYKDPNLKEILNYIFKTYPIIAINIFKKFFLKESIWNVAYKKRNISYDLSKLNVIKNRTKCFNADPFIFKFQNNNYLFVENYSFKKKRGNISVYKIFDDKYEFLGDALIEKFHLSFPFVFSYNEKIYMCPETSELNEIRIYESTEFPLKWKYCKTLIQDISAADTILFEQDNIWWLFTNVDLSNINDHNSELSIYYSNEGPLTNNWIEHENNPIIIDPDRARNGGIIIDKNSIYRVSQKHDYNIYGKEININLINELSNKSYIEEKIHNIKPSFKKKINASHHFSANQDFIAIDFY